MSGDASWWTSVVDGLPAKGTHEVLCLTEEGGVVVQRPPRHGRALDWFDEVGDSGRVIAWAHIPHHDFALMDAKYREALERL